MQNSKENFYVFLDFDGVLYDIKYLLTEKIKNQEKLFRYAPDSIDALNKLFALLSTKYTPHLVVSSFWRKKFPFFIEFLKQQGFDIIGIPLTKIDNTTSIFKRGLEIKNFLERKNNCENFIIIDDFLFDFKKYFPKEKIIKTNMLNDRLTEDKLYDALSFYNLDIEDKISIEK